MQIQKHLNLIWHRLVPIKRWQKLITSAIILKTEDTIQIQEPLNLPMNQKIMYKIEHEEDKVVVHSNNGKIVIPVENILFVTSVPFDDGEADEI